MDLCYRRALDSEIQNGRLKLDTEGDGETLLFKEKRNIVKQILLLVVKDSLTDEAKRNVTLGRSIFNC